MLSIFSHLWKHQKVSALLRRRLAVATYVNQTVGQMVHQHGCYSCYADPSTVWGSNCGDAGAKNVRAEYSADLGIFAAEQSAAVYRQSRVACSERLFKPETWAQQFAVREEHVQQAVQPQAASNVAAEASIAIQQSESLDRQSSSHVPSSASIPVPTAFDRPSLVSASSNTKFIPKM
jgi:hypothetical protein